MFELANWPLIESTGSVFGSFVSGSKIGAMIVVESGPHSVFSVKPGMVSVCSLMPSEVTTSTSTTTVSRKVF
jgi:hypothetical protein